MLKICLIFVVFGVVFAYREVVYENNSPETKPTCLNMGGICVPPGECPEGRLSVVSGLCSDQYGGFECCHGLPISETRCRQRGGECMPISNRCPDVLDYNEASDCEYNEKCCILVK